MSHPAFGVPHENPSFSICFSPSSFFLRSKSFLISIARHFLSNPSFRVVFSLVPLLMVALWGPVARGAEDGKPAIAKDKDKDKDKKKKDDAASSAKADSAADPETTRDDSSDATIIVTANRLPTRQDQTGVSTDVITAEDKATNLDHSAGEMLRMVPGISITESGRSGDFSTIRTRGGESDHTLIMYDGFRTNRQGGLFVLDALDPVGIDRMEIARGPGSVLYGSDAVTGTVNLITAKGEGRPDLTVSAAAGTYGTDLETIRIQGRHQWFSYNVASARLYRAEANVKNSDLETINYSARFDFQLASQHALKLIFRGNDLDKGNYQNSGNGMGPAINPPDPNDRGRSNSLLAGVEYSGRPLPIWQTVVRAGYFEQEALSRVKPPGTSSGFTASTRRFSRLWRPTLEWQNNVTAYEDEHIQLIATAGYTLEYEHLKNHNSDSNTPIGTRDQNGHLNQSLYLQTRLALWDRAFVTLGGRREENNDFGEFWTGRADVSILIPETETRVFGSVGNALRAPSFFELFAPTFGNPGLTPEENFAYDVGIEQHLWERKINLKATWFHNQFDDLIGFDPNTFVSINVADAQTRGFELFAGLYPLKHIGVEANATLMSSKDTNGLRLPRRAPRTYTARIVARPLWGFVPDEYADLTISLEAFHVSNRSDFDFSTFPSRAVRTADYARGDLAVRYKFLKHFTAFMRVENFTDKEYEDVFSFPADGAKVLGGLEFHWRF